MKRCLLLHAAGAMLVGFAQMTAAQTTTNSVCTQVGTQTICNQTTRPQSGGVLGAVGGMFAAYGKDKETLAQRARDSLYEAQQDALLNAQIQSLQSAAAEADAQSRAFGNRASFVVAKAADSLGLKNETRAKFFADATPPLRDLFTANPLASNSAMQDALAPVTSQYMSLIRSFALRCQSALDSVIAARAIPAERREALLSAAMPWLEAKLQSDITAGTWDLGQTIGGAADSAGAASWDHIQKPIPAVPHKKKP